jgi:hypothetical protein
MAAGTDSNEPLTKTKLFTQGEEGSWTEIGVGIARIDYASANSNGGNASSNGDGANGNGSSPTSPAAPSPAALEPPRLIIESLEEYEGEHQREMLLSTPLSADDIYQVQKGTILIWTDPELARDMAASFHTADGCRYIMSKIDEYRAQQQALRPDELVGPSSVTSGGSTGTDPYANVSPWSVSRENLQALRLGVQNNRQRFAAVVRDNQDFGVQLTNLFVDCRSRSDASGQQIIAEIVYALLNPPFCLDNRILGQFVDECTIENTIDAVQYFLGRRDRASGFVSAEERREGFRNPAGLPELLVRRTHFIASIQRLKDLLPLQLDETDAAQAGLLTVYVLRLRYELLCEVVQPDSTLGATLQLNDKEPLSDTIIAGMLEVVPLLHELTTGIRNSAIPFEPKESLLTAATNQGLLKYATSAFRLLLTVDADRRRAQLRVAEPLAADGPDVPVERIEWRVSATNSILGRLADCISHCMSFAPKSRDDLLIQAALLVNRTKQQQQLATTAAADNSQNQHSLLALMLAAVASIDDRVTQQSFADAIHFAAFRPPITPMDQAAWVEEGIELTISFWTNGIPWSVPSNHVERERRALASPKLPPAPWVPAELLISSIRDGVEAGLAAAATVPSPSEVVAARRSNGRSSRELSASPAVSRARFAAKALAIILKRLFDSLAAPQQRPRYIETSLSASLVAALNAAAPSLCKAAVSEAIDPTLRMSVLQLLTTFLHVRLPTAAVIDENLDAFTACIGEIATARRRRNLVYGTASALVKQLMDAVAVERGELTEDGPANRAAMSLQSATTTPGPARRLARRVFVVYGERIRTADPALFAALETLASENGLAMTGDDDVCSVASAQVGATGRRVSPPRASTAPSRNLSQSPEHGDQTAAGNPYLPRRSTSRSQSRGNSLQGVTLSEVMGGGAASIDDEFHALMAEFDAAVPPPPTTMDDAPAHKSTSGVADIFDFEDDVTGAQGANAADMAGSTATLSVASSSSNSVSSPLAVPPTLSVGDDEETLEQPLKRTRSETTVTPLDH